MPEPHPLIEPFPLPARSPLQSHWRQGQPAYWQRPGLYLRERPDLHARLCQRRRPAAECLPGIACSTEPNRAQGQWPTSLWLAPGEYLLLWLPEADTQTEPVPSLASQQAQCAPGVYLSEQSSRYCAIEMGGDKAIELLASGCGLDLHPQQFQAGHCARTLFAQLDVLLFKPQPEPRFVLLLERGEAEYGWRWLRQAAERFT